MDSLTVEYDDKVWVLAQLVSFYPLLWLVLVQLNHQVPLVYPFPLISPHDDRDIILQAKDHSLLLPCRSV